MLGPRPGDDSAGVGIVMTVADRLLRARGAEHPVEYARGKLADEVGAVGGDQRAQTTSQARRVRRRPNAEAEAPEYLREALVDVVTARPADQVAATLPADIAQLLRRPTRGGV